jgi:hypothetical protein
LALTEANIKSLGDIAMERSQLVDVTGDAAYPTGGYTGLDTALGMSGRGIIAVHSVDGKGYQVGYDVTNKKLKFYQQPAAAAAGPSPEVPNGTNLSAVTVTLLVFGE